RWRLLRQLLTESTLISVAGGALGILLARWGVPLLLSLAPAHSVPRSDEIQLDYQVLAFTAALSVITGLAFGAIPAIQATGRDVGGALNQGGRTQTGRRTLRHVLVVAEMALALVLLTGAGLMLKSFARMSAVDPGFRPESTLTMTVDLPPAAYRDVNRIRAF